MKQKNKRKINKTFTEVMEEHEERQQSKKAFINFLKPYPVLIAIPFLVGAILAASVEFGGKHYQYLYDPKGWIAFTLLVFKEIGLGLIVSAVAVFGYETIHKIRGEFINQERQIGILNSMDKATKVLSTTKDFILIEKGYFRDSGEKVLRKLFPDDEGVDRKFREVIKNMVTTASFLRDVKTIYGKSYVSFVTWLCEGVVNKHLERLADFETSAEKKTGMVNFTFPQPEAVAAQLLHSQLICLEEEDSYQTISNILFWERKDFQNFWKANIRACEDGVKIQRLFNLSNLANNDELLKTKFKIAQKIIIEHKELENAPHKKYEIRFFTKKIAKTVSDSHQDNWNTLSESNLYSFGIFTHKLKTGKNDTDVVSFTAKDQRQFSHILISRDKTDVEDYISEFKDLWEISIVENPFEKDIGKFKEIIN